MENAIFSPLRLGVRGLPRQPALLPGECVVRQNGMVTRLYFSRAGAPGRRKHRVAYLRIMLDWP